jgi:uncharacterized protein YqgC (DUF456 family)
VADTLWLVGLAITGVVGVLLALVRLPGSWLVLVAAVACSWHFSWTRPPWQLLFVLAGLAIVGEIIEFLGSAVTARRAGASGRTSIAALVGGMVGMFVFSIPLPVIGTILGGLLGCFIGAVVSEVTVRRDTLQGVRVGLYAAVGQILGTLGKTIVTFVMAVAALMAALGYGR